MNTSFKCTYLSLARPYGSAKYPMLSPTLAHDSHPLQFDVAKQPRTVINPQVYSQTHGTPAFAYPVMHMRLISKHFPWSIDIVTQTPITCEAVWDAMHAALQEHLADSEWGCIASDKRQKETIEKAAEKRQESEPETRVKRIDWLGQNTVFKGLEKNEDFEKARLMPGSKPCPETWLIRLGN